MTIYEDALIENLRKQTFCRLAPSDIHGIGVFAIKDIPKGTEVFQLCNDAFENIIELTDEYVESLDESVTKYIQDIFIRESTGLWALPECGLNSLNISFFLNHCNRPNLKPVMAHGYATWVSNKVIKSGKELTNDYRLLGPLEQVYEQFSWLK